MASISVGDMAQSLILSRQGADLKRKMQDLSTEVTTGLVANKTEQLRGNYVPIAGIEASLTQISAFHAVTSESAILTSAMQTTLGQISDHATALGSSLLAAAGGNSPTRIDALGTEAMQRLKSVMSSLNTRIGERSVFSGMATDRSAVTDTETMMTALDTAITGSISSADVETAVNAWFADPLGFAASVYTGGDPLSPIPVGPDETATIDVTAVDPGIVDTIKGLAMAALLQRGALAGSDVARADLAKRAGESLASTASSRVQLSARLGTVEAGIANASLRNDTEKSALETARLDILAVDPFETATKLQQTQSQLESLYTITARMSRLSLVDFL